MASGANNPEQLAARTALPRLHGPGVDEVIRSGLDAAPENERTELQRALNARGKEAN